MRNSRVTSVRALLTRCLLFLLPVVLLLATMEWRFRQIPTSLSQKRRALDAKASSLRVLVIGSATAPSGVGPRYVGVAAFKSGNIAQDIYYNHAILERYVDSMTKLELVIYVVDFHSLEYRIGDTEF